MKEEFKKYDKYLVLKWDDIEKYLKYSRGYSHLDGIIRMINEGRMRDGKKHNDYIVVNEDEPYAGKVWELIADNQFNTR